MATASRLQRQGWGRGSPLLKAWTKATDGLSEGSRALQDVVPSLLPVPSSSPTGLRLGDLQALLKNA